MNASEHLIMKYIQLKEKYSKVIMLYPQTTVSTTEFDLTIEQKIKLVDAGRDAVKQLVP